MRATEAAALALGAMTEREFQDGQVIPLARLHGWAVYHTHDSRRSSAGFPDLCLVRERVVFAELKRQKGRTSREQDEWMDLLRAAGAEVYLWRPADWEEIVTCLTRREPGGTTRPPTSDRAA